MQLIHIVLSLAAAWGTRGAMDSALSPAPSRSQVETSAADSAFGRDWIAKTTDSVCGLRDLSQVSNPAKVDWQSCMDATPEMKKAKQDKIDLETPEGIQLVIEASNRVTTACETTRSANGYCSVWKAIKHKDGRDIADITELVKAQY